MQQMHRLKRKIITIDADDLTSHPRKVLHNLCAQLNIPFKANDLHWQSSENIWNKSEAAWQKHVLKSKQIEKHANTHKISDIQYPHRAGIEKLIQKNKEIYMQLKNFK